MSTHSKPQMSDQSDVPQPLHIIKRPDSGWGRKPPSRRYSTEGESGDSDTSVGSVPEPPGGDMPLTIPKRRGVASTSRPITAPISRPRRSTSCTDPREAEGGIVPHQPSGQVNVPPPVKHRQLVGVIAQGGTGRRRTKGTDQSAANQAYTRLDYSRLRNSKSMLHMTASPYHSYNNTSEEPSDVPLSPSDSYSTRDSPQSHPVPSPCVLVPRITVTPETKVLDDGVNDLWVAVQLSAQVCWANSAYHTPDDHYGNRRGSQPDEFQYGCLYDVSVDVLPTANSKIVEVFDDRASCTKTTLYPGSRLLLMARIQLSGAVTVGNRARGHVRQSSDDLIQDLEHALGTTAMEYLQVRMTYRHSGFPYQAPVPSASAGESDTTITTRSGADTTSIETKMETMARATIKRCNSTSPWSPRPGMLQNPPLFEIIASHWGPASAREVMHRITARSRPLPPLPRKPASSSAPLCGNDIPPSTPVIIEERISDETVRASPAPAPAPPPIRAAPPIPKRQTSLHRASIPQYAVQAPQSQEPASTSVDLEDYDSESDPARKIWTQMRGADNGARPSYHVSRVKKVPSSATMIPQPTPSSITREVAVAVRRLLPDEEPAELATPSSRKTGSGVATMRGRGSRVEMEVNNRATGGGDHAQARMLRGAASLANLRGDEAGDGKVRRMGGTGMGTTGVGAGMGVGPAGIAVGMGLGAGTRMMPGMDAGPGTRHYGTTTGKGGKKDKDAGKWGWSGWWQ